MLVYLYSEDFERNTFIPYRWNGRIVERISEDRWPTLFGWLSRRECSLTTDASGVAAQCISHIRAYFTFKFLVDERSPKGRQCLVFGCSESVLVTEWLKKPLQSLKKGVECYLSEVSLKAPNERIEALIKTIEDECCRVCKHT